MGLIWVWWNTVEHVMHAKSIHLVIHEESIAIEKPYSCPFLFFHVVFLLYYFSFSIRRLLDERLTNFSKSSVLSSTRRINVRKMNELSTSEFEIYELQIKIIKRFGGCR